MRRFLGDIAVISSYDLFVETWLTFPGGALAKGPFLGDFNHFKECRGMCGLSKIVWRRVHGLSVVRDPSKFSCRCGVVR